MKRRKPLIKTASKDFHQAPTAKGTALPEKARNHLTAATRVHSRDAANNPTATKPATTPASFSPVAPTAAPAAPAFVGVSEPGKTDAATAAPATPAPVVVASATPTPTATSRGGSVGSWCFFTNGDGSHYVVNCAEVSAVRAPLEREYRPEIHAVMSVGRGLMTARESVETVRQMVLSHGGHL